MQSVLFLNGKTLQNIKRFHWLNRRTEENEVFSHCLHNPCCHLEEEKQTKQNPLDNIWFFFLFYINNEITHSKFLSENSALISSSTAREDKETSSLKSHPIHRVSQKILSLCSLWKWLFGCLFKTARGFHGCTSYSVFWNFGSCYFKVLNVLHQNERLWLRTDISPDSTDCLHIRSVWTDVCSKAHGQSFFPQQRTM